MSEREHGNWFAIAAYALVGACTQMLWLTYTPITTQAATYYSASEGEIGTLSIIFPFIYVVLAIPAGLLLDRWFRPSLMLGAGLTAIGGIVRIVDDSFTVALVGMVLIAIGQPFVLNAVTKLCVDYLPPSQRATGIAVGTAGLFVGMLIAFVTGGLLQNNIAALLIIQALLSVIAAAALGASMLKEGRFGSQLEIEPGMSMQAASDKPLRTVWGDPAMRLLIGVVAVGFGVFVALTTWLQALLDPVGVTATDASLMLLIMVIAGIVGAAVLPPIASKRNIQTTLMLCAISAAVLGCLVLGVIPSAATGYIVSGVLGLLLLAMLPIVLEMVEERAGPAASTATALVWLAGNGGGVIVSGIIGLVLNTPALAFALMAAVPLFVGFPIVLLLRRRLASEAAS